VLSGRFLGFLRDWVPFVALFLGYEAVRGIAPKAGFPRHYGFVIRLDKLLSGGVVPSQWLQAHLGSLRFVPPLPGHGGSGHRGTQGARAGRDRRLARRAPDAPRHAPARAVAR
jgi:hypothetical protein